MNGRKYICGNHGNITLEKQWSPHAQPFAYQTTVKVTKKHASISRNKYITYTIVSSEFPEIQNLMILKRISVQSTAVMSL